MGWKFPGRPARQHFNFDFNVSFTEEQQREGGIEYNYQREAAWQLRARGDCEPHAGDACRDNAAMTGTDVARTRASGRA